MLTLNMLLGEIAGCRELTEKGLALLPIIEGMRAYGTNWLGAECAGEERTPAGAAGSARGPGSARCSSCAASTPTRFPRR